MLRCWCRCIVYFDGVDDGEPCALSIAQYLSPSVRRHRVGVPSELPLEIPASDRHGVAAMLLHEQPFGFTQKDVELLRALSKIEQVLALADRIEALLP